ncbi:YdbC family protein [Kitasatospora cinereorecta]
MPLRAPYDGAVLVKWIRCTVVDRRGFERGQRKWAGLLDEPGFRGQGGGWSRGRPEVAHVFAFWENRVFYDAFMAREHDRLAAGQSGMYRDMQVKLFEYRFDVKTGFEPHFTDADVVRVAHSQVREDRVDHFALMQERVWNPAMAGSPGMLRGVFGEAPGREFLVLSMWQSSAERGKYRPESIARLSARAETERDVEALTGDVVQLEPSWTV